MKFNSFEDLKCLKPKEVLEEEERQERLRELNIKALKAANNICNVVRRYYINISDYNYYRKNNPNEIKPKKPKIKDLEIVFDYIERNGLRFKTKKETSNEDVYYASLLVSYLYDKQSKFIGSSLSAFKTFVKKFI